MIQAFVTGNIGKDAVLRDAGGTPVCSFSVASNAKIKGEKVTTWVDCSIWAKRGEALVKYLRAGTRVAVSGELGTRTHEGKTYLTLRVSEIDIMGGSKKDEKPDHRSDADEDNYGGPDPF